MEDAVAPAPNRLSRQAGGVVAILIGLFVSLSVAAEWHKSITTDELIYTVAGYINLRTGDFRCSPEHPPLWKMWASLGTLNDRLFINFNDPNWSLMPQEPGLLWPFSISVAYRIPGNDIDRLIWHCRPLMIAVGAMLAVLIGRWAKQLGGGIAAVTATVMFCLDPNFIAHSALVTNDVSVTFALTLATYAVWRVGNRITPWRLLLLGLAGGLCLNTKLSGLLFAPLVIGLMLARALLPRPWTAFNKSLTNRGSKLVAALAAIFCCVAISYGITWCGYGLRFSATADASQQLNFDRVIYNFAGGQLQAMHPDKPPTQSEFSAWHRPMAISAIVFLKDHHLLPEGWLYGVLYSLQNTQSRPAFLLGEQRDTGWWYYFPLVILFKEPTATLVAVGAIAVVASPLLFNTRRWLDQAWIAACLGLPFALYVIVTMQTSMDIGVRYILPLFPWMYIATGVGIAYAWRRRPRLMSYASSILAVGLATEIAVAFPNYLAFFNAPSGGSRGGIRLLGDSNLDWGQELFALRDWQHAHPSADLYLCYFGGADPAYYGIRYTPLPGGYPFDRTPQRWPSKACTVAISATYLQGLYLQPDLRRQYTALVGRLQPKAVLNGSIYLFDVDPSVL